MGNYDQFTDVAVFPDLCMDTMLPPGMLRNKTLGLDKSLMGLELCGGGGSTHTTVESKYDDQWIKDQFADYTEKYKDYTKGQDVQNTTLQALQQGLGSLNINKAGKGWTEGKIADLNKALTGDIGDLGSALEALKTTSATDIANLDKILQETITQSKFSDEQSAKARQDILTQLGTVKDTYASKDYLADSLGGLEDTLTTDFEDQLSGVQSDLSGDISALGTDFASQLSESEKTGAQNLADVKAALESDYGSQITDLSDTFGNKLDTTAASLTDTFGQKYDTLSDQLAGAEGDLAAHKSDTESKFSDVAAQYSGLSTDLADLGTDTAAKFSQAYRDAETMYNVIDDDISDLDVKFGTELGAAKDHMAAQLKSTDEALNKRLTDISKSMNYRMLGNTASGVKIRRSKAFNRGSTSRGTGQLSRKMKIGNLNL